MDGGNKELLDYFIEHTNVRFSEVKAEINELKKEVQSLNTFRWKAAGVLAAVTFAGVFLFELAKEILKGG